MFHGFFGVPSCFAPPSLYFCASFTVVLPPTLSLPLKNTASPPTEHSTHSFFLYTTTLLCTTLIDTNSHDATFQEPFNLNKMDDHGNTLLMVAAQNGHLKMAKLFIYKGANPNHQVRNAGMD